MKNFDLNKIYEELPEVDQEKQQFMDYMMKKHDTIVEAIRSNGKYAHNVIGLVLTEVHKRYGDDAANYLVRKNNLTKRFGIKEKR